MAGDYLRGEEGKVSTPEQDVEKGEGVREGEREGGEGDGKEKKTERTHGGYESEGIREIRR